MFIEVTSKNGSKIYVNILHISEIYELSGKSRIVLDNSREDNYIDIQESYIDVIKFITEKLK